MPNQLEAGSILDERIYRANLRKWEYEDVIVGIHCMFQRIINASKGRLGEVVCLALISATLVSGCGLDVKEDYLVLDPMQRDAYIYESELKNKGAGYGSTIFGDGGLDLLNLGRGGKKGLGGPGVAVNSYLWRATLDTIAFMPLSSADPFGGVIITDWYSPPESPKERYKLSVYIMARQLRADGVKVAVFRQKTNAPGTWQSETVSKDTAINLENKILVRARQLRVASNRNR